MKIQTKSNTQGSVLLVSLLTASVIGVALGSYLTLTSTQNQSVFRSMTWNEGIPVAEAGIDEALAQIRYHTVNNLSANNWTWGLDGRYHKQRSIGDDGAYFDVGIQPVDPPVIVATAYVRAPLTPTSAYAMIFGTVNSSQTTKPYVKRRVQVNTRGTSLFEGAMLAKRTIDFNGQTVTTDGFNSKDPNYSTNGMYDPNPAKTKPIGDVKTNMGANGNTAAINVGNADIKGHVSTGPGGEVRVGANGAVGDLAWVDGGSQGIQPGYRGDDSNMDMIDIEEPFSGGYFTPMAQTVNGVSYDYVLPLDANYKLSVVGGKVLVTGHATLWVTDLVFFSGSTAGITIAPGASLKLFVSAPVAVISGNGVMNGNNDATTFQYYGLPTNTTLMLAGNSSFTGTIYAPQAHFRLGGGGNTVYDFVGAATIKSVQMNGHYRFHYDEDLRNSIPGPYVVASWTELDPNVN